MELATIVGEVSANYIGNELPINGPIGRQFEVLIEVNLLRGYDLSSWHFSRVATFANGRTESINETIIAVFVARSQGS